MEVSISAAESQPTLWTSLAEAIRGSHQDYTSGSLNRAIFLLAVPMVLEMVLESLFAVVDVFWVGRLGANAVATVGLTESMLSLVFAVAMGLSLPTTAMVARRIGERDSTGAAVAAVQAIALGLMLSIVIGHLAWCWPRVCCGGWDLPLRSWPSAAVTPGFVWGAAAWC